MRRMSNLIVRTGRSTTLPTEVKGIMLAFKLPRSAMLLVLLSLWIPSSSAARRYRRHKISPSNESLMRAAERGCVEKQCSSFDDHARQTCIFRCISDKCYDQVFGQDEVRDPFCSFGEIVCHMPDR